LDCRETNYLYSSPAVVAVPPTIFISGSSFKEKLDLEPCCHTEAYR
jgi:hypothetical protein